MYILEAKEVNTLELSVLIPLIALVCTMFGAFVAFLTFSRNRDKDVKRDAAENAVIKTQLTNILSGIDSIRIDIKANEKKVTELSEKYVIVDASLKSLHKRVDRIEGVNELGRSNL